MFRILSAGTSEVNKKLVQEISLLRPCGFAAADKVHDLQLVAVFELRGLPVGARNNLQVEFHGNAVRLHAELFHQRSQSQPVREVACFAIDMQGHEKIGASLNL